MAKIIKYIYAEEHVWGGTEENPYRLQRCLYDMKWNLIVKFDPCVESNNQINL